MHTSLGRRMRTGFRGSCSSGPCDGYVMCLSAGSTISRVARHSTVHVEGGSMGRAFTGGRADEEMVPLPHRLPSRGRDHGSGCPKSVARNRNWVGARARLPHRPAPHRDAQPRVVVGHNLDLARPPGLVEKRLERAVEAQDREPALPGTVRIQVPSGLSAGGPVRAPPVSPSTSRAPGGRAAPTTRAPPPPRRARRDRGGPPRCAR